MNFVEQVNLRAVKWLLTNLSNDFINSNIGENEMERFHLTNIKKILQDFEKHDGKLKTTYKKGSTDTYGILRDYTQGIQGLPTSFRGLLCKDIMTDIDMVNCHPTILLNICKQHDIPCEYLNKYCLTRKELIEAGHASKTDIFRSMNKKQKLKDCTPFMTAFDNEMKIIQTVLLGKPEYARQKEMALKNKTNMNGAFMSHVCTSHEVQILHEIISYLKSIDVKIGVLMFDGLMIYGSADETLLTNLSSLVQSRFNFEVKFSFKEHDCGSLQIPDDFEVVNSDQIYQMLKTKYETDNQLAYIVNHSFFTIKNNNKLLLKSEDQMKLHFATNLEFWFNWISDKTRQEYDELGIYPHDIICPPNILNTWTGFEVEKIKNPKIVDIEPILTHINIISNHDDSVYNFFLDWMANMFQYPSSPSILVYMFGAEGCGKTTIVQLLNNMIGIDKTRDVSNPKTQLFGQFNGDLENAVLINLNEVERHEMSSFYEKMKPKINAEMVDVHYKGKSPYEIKNIRHYICTTNHPDSIVIKEGNRRYASWECSNELVGNSKYFDELFPLIENKNVQYSFYKYLMDRKVPKRFKTSDIPITEALQDAYDLSRDPVEDYAKQFSDTDEIHAEYNYELYRQFLDQCGLQYSLSRKQFDARFSRVITKYGIIKHKTDIIIDRKRITTIYSKKLFLQ